MYSKTGMGNTAVGDVLGMVRWMKMAAQRENVGKHGYRQMRMW